MPNDNHSLKKINFWFIFTLDVYHEKNQFLTLLIHPCSEYSKTLIIVFTFIQIVILFRRIILL